MEMGGGWYMEPNFQLLIYERGVLWNQTANDGNGSVGRGGLFGTTWSMTEMGEGVRNQMVTGGNGRVAGWLLEPHGQ